MHFRDFESPCWFGARICGNYVCLWTVTFIKARFEKQLKHVSWQESDIFQTQVLVHVHLQGSSYMYLPLLWSCKLLFLILRGPWGFLFYHVLSCLSSLLTTWSISTTLNYQTNSSKVSCPNEFHTCLDLPCLQPIFLHIFSISPHMFPRFSHIRPAKTPNPQPPLAVAYIVYIYIYFHLYME